MSSKTYYVYKHFNPASGELLYIGHGWKSRAWVHGGRKTVSRNQEHLDDLEKLNEAGYLPCDYVEILHRGMTKPEACRVECELIRELRPKHNKVQGRETMKIDEDGFLRIVKLRDSGMSYKDIGDAMGVAAMTVHRYLNGKVKNAQNYGSV